jgi:excisionase family DNA binding protein
MKGHEHPPRRDPDGRLLTTAEVATYLGVPARTVESWRYKRTGPPGIRLGRHVRYRQRDVDAWLRCLEGDAR